MLQTLLVSLIASIASIADGESDAAVICVTNLLQLCHSICRTGRPGEEGG